MHIAKGVAFVTLSCCIMAGRKRLPFEGSRSLCCQPVGAAANEALTSGGPVLYAEGGMRLQGNRRGAAVLIAVSIAILILLVVGYVVFVPR